MVIALSWMLTTALTFRGGCGVASMVAAEIWIFHGDGAQGAVRFSDGFSFPRRGHGAKDARSVEERPPWPFLVHYHVFTAGSMCHGAAGTMWEPL